MIIWDVIRINVVKKVMRSHLMQTEHVNHVQKICVVDHHPKMAHVYIVILVIYMIQNPHQLGIVSKRQDTRNE